jgi:hypothetical protein
MAGIARAAAPYYDPTAEGIKRGQAAAEMVGQLGKAVSGLSTTLRQEKLARRLLKERGIEAPKFGSAWDQLQDMYAQKQLEQKLGSEALEQEVRRAQIADYLGRPEQRAAKSAAEQAKEAESLRRYEEGRGFQTRAEARDIAAQKRQEAAELAKQYPFAAFQTKVDRITGGKSQDWLKAQESGQIEYVNEAGVPTEVGETTSGGTELVEGLTTTPKGKAYARIKGTEERMPVSQYESLGAEMQGLAKKYPGYDIMARPPASAAPEAAPTGGGPPVAQGNVVPFQSREQVQSLPSGTRIQMPDGQVVTRR